MLVYIFPPRLFNKFWYLLPERFKQFDSLMSVLPMCVLNGTEPKIY